MPKISNVLNLPEPLVTAVQNDGYNRGEIDFSTTELIGPPRIAVLKQQWAEHLVEDVSDRIFALLGKSVHTILEHSASERYLVEKRFIVEHDGYKIGGQIDLYDTLANNLQDWKVTSRHTTADALRKFPWSQSRTAPEGKGWVEQGNINRYLMRQHGHRVDVIQYIAIYRDWSKMQVGTARDYPHRQVEVLKIPIWPEAKTKAYLSERIRLHVAAKTELPMCTPEERWESPAGWAVTKAGNKRAYRVLETELQAQELAAEMSKPKAQYVVTERPAVSKRCLYYCPVAQFCSFGRQLLEQKQEEELE